MKMTFLLLCFLFCPILVWGQQGKEIDLNEIINQLETLRPTLTKEVRIRPTSPEHYFNLKTYIISIGEAYKKVYWEIEIRDSLNRYIQKVAHSFVEEKHPVIIIDGHRSRTIATETNKIRNGLNPTLIEIDGDCIVPIDVVPSGNNESFDFDMDIQISHSAPIGEKLELSGLFPISNLFAKIAFQKFNEYTLLAFEQHYGVDAAKKLQYKKF